MISDQASITSRPTQDRPKRSSPATCQFEASPELLAALFSPELTEERPQKSNRFAPDSSNASNEVTNPQLNQTAQPQKQPSRRSISDSFDQFDFSLDDSLAQKLNSDPYMTATNISDDSNPLAQTRKPEHRSSGSMRALAGISANNNPAVPGRISSSSYRSVQSASGNHRAIPSATDDSSGSIANQLLSDNPLSTNEIPRNNELLRGVDNIDYDFSKQNIRNIRESQAAHPDATQTSDASAQDHGFTSWIFDDKYEIDTPMPDPQKMQPCKVSLMQRFLIPATPAIVVLALTLAVGSVIPMVGIGLLLIAIVCLIIELPAMRSASQETPQAALMTSLNARSGACPALGFAVLARSTTKSEDPASSDIWNEPAPNPLLAFINRFRAIDTPKTKIVSGSDTQNALILLCTTQTKYYVIPMVRLDNKWYIATPISKPHNL